MAQVICLQPVAIVDHVAHVTEDQLKAILGDEEQHGSRRVDATTAQQTLHQIGKLLRLEIGSENDLRFGTAGAFYDLSVSACSTRTSQLMEAGLFTQVEVRPGGSSANCCRAMAAGFGVRAKIIGVRGNDDAGVAFHDNMQLSKVDTSQLYSRECPTGCSIILSCDGERTMRTCMDGCERLQASDVTSACLQAQYVMLSGYCLYGPNFTKEVIETASKAGAKVIFDLASFEIVRRFHTDIWDIINSGNVYAVFGNADEWQALGVGCEAPADTTASHQAAESGADADLSHLHQTQARVVQHCHLAVATRGSQGCTAVERTGEPCTCPAMVLDDVKDPTGAGDLFAAGFVHGLLAGVSIRDCCRIGCVCGAAGTQMDGAEMTPPLWSWVYSHLDGLPTQANTSAEVMAA